MKTHKQHLEEFDEEFKSYFKGMAEYSNRLHPILSKILKEFAEGIKGKEETDVEKMDNFSFLFTKGCNKTINDFQIKINNYFK